MKIAVVIPSKNAANLAACVAAIRKLETVQPRIIVVNDGLESVPDGVEILPGVKPFVFARNANIGLDTAFESGADVAILCNDDALLETPDGFASLAATARQGWIYPVTQFGYYGIVSAAVKGGVGNGRQGYCGAGDRVRPEPKVLCFVCVAIPFEAWEILGPLDQRFVTYGWEDNDYCKRAIDQGLKLGVYDGCVVEHGSLPSTFRGPGGPGGDIAPGRAIFREIHGEDAA